MIRGLSEVQVLWCVLSLEVPDRLYLGLIGAGQKVWKRMEKGEIVKTSYC